uniref:Uncharacterized protein n=1 Tax=Populus alba TaxID=43335 RepID=A0A4U5NNI1_POPAL|nr:hypothetical protein D5086_0000250210 [Populus alba]
MCHITSSYFPFCAVSAPTSSLVYAMPAHAAAPGCAMSVPIAPTRGTAPSANPVREIPNSSKPSSNAWRNLFVNNRNTVSCPRLIHYSTFTDTKGCNLVDDDLDTKCELWKLCIVGYIAGRYTGFKALQNLIDNTWKCEASLTMHESGWLIFKFAKEEDKLNVLSGGPYLVFGRPLILRAMPEYFDFSSSDMYTIPVWVKFPNLPLKCWSIKCLSKIASVLGKPVQSDMLTSSMARLSYARVLVEVNLLSDLPYSIEVTLPNGSILHQQVVYETLPRFCKHCRKLGHITSSCTKSQPSNVPSKPRANDSVAPVPNVTKGRDSVFNRLGPQGGTSVAGCSEANEPANCGPNPVPVVDEIISENGTVMPNSGGWELVQRKKVRRKPSPSRNSSGSAHVALRVAQENSNMVHRARLPSPPLSIACNISPPVPADVAGHRADKGKSVVISSAPSHLASKTLDIPTRRKTLQHTSDDPGRRTLWNDLRNWSPSSPWLILGDFNSLLSQADKHHGEPVSNYKTTDFRQCCSDLGLTDLNYSGCHFTWSNGSVWSKLDLVLVNPFWSLANVSVHVQFDNPGAFSDHSPATVAFFTRQLMGKQSFKFFNMWANHATFLELVAAQWTYSVYGSPMFILCKRLKNLKRPLRDLNKLHYSHISERVARAEADLDTHQTLLSNDRDNIHLQSVDKQLRQGL